MENSLLEFYRELSAKSEEIGKLKAQLEMKDKAIEGLEAMLSLRGVTVTSVDTSLTSSFPSVEHSCKCGKEVVESAKVESAKAALSKLEEKQLEIEERRDALEKAGASKLKMFFFNINSSIEMFLQKFRYKELSPKDLLPANMREADKFVSDSEKIINNEITLRNSLNELFGS